MKKTLLAITMTVSLVAAFAVSALADSETFIVSVEMPSAQSVNFIATEIDADGTWATTPLPSTTMDFGLLEYKAGLGIFLPDKYFAIDLAADGSGDVTNITVSYDDTTQTNPNDAAGNGRGGLEKKGTVKMVEARYQQADLPVGDLKAFEDADYKTFVSGDFANGGWPRIYVGISDGTVGEPFTSADAVGTYEGELTVTATAQ